MPLASRNSASVWHRNCCSTLPVANALERVASWTDTAAQVSSPAQPGRFADGPYAIDKRSSTEREWEAIVQALPVAKGASNIYLVAHAHTGVRRQRKHGISNESHCFRAQRRPRGSAIQGHSRAKAWTQ